MKNQKVHCDSSTKEACLVFLPAIAGMGEITYYIIDYDRVKTNNQGEYFAVRTAFDLLSLLGITGANVMTDSLLVVNQVEGLFKCSIPEFITIRDEIREYIKGTDSTLSWVPREENLAGIELERIDKERRKKREKKLTAGTETKTSTTK